MRKLIVILSVCSLLGLINCTSIDVALSKNVDYKNKMDKIAVFPFDVSGADWGNQFADSITHHFFKTGRIEIIERESIEKVFKEQGLSMSGVVDQKKAVQIGKLLGADVIITGRGSALRGGDNLIDTFSLKAINVETGALIITVRKEPGTAWDWRYRMKVCCSGYMIWDTKDALKQSSEYDDISKQIVKKILEAFDELEKEKASIKK